VNERLGNKREMPDVPTFDFAGTLAEIWFQRILAGRRNLTRLSTEALRAQCEIHISNSQRFTNARPTPPLTSQLANFAPQKAWTSMIGKSQGETEIPLDSAG
jgi:hypothetical protein